jgi:RNA polymerase sigma-70 factor (ECF subfamily)
VSIQFNTPDDAWSSYRRELHAFVLSRVRDSAAAEDIVHDVLVRAYERRDQLLERRSLKAWLYAITRNTIVDHYRSKRPHEELPEEIARESVDDDLELIDQLARCMRPLIKSLPVEYGRPLEMADLEGAQQADVAAAMGLTLSGAKSRIQRGRKKLRDALLACCEIELDDNGRPHSFEHGVSNCEGC